MRAAAVILGTLLGVVVAGPGYAVFESGEDLKDFCTPSTPTHNVERCLGYITGAFDMLELHEVAIGPDGEVPKKTVCVPKGKTNVDVGQVVISYIYDNPGELNLPAAALIANALVKDFPCPK